jgi:type IV secretory pathway VirB2 component (pilin)
MEGKIWQVLVLVMLVALPMVSAVDFNNTITPEEQAAFDNILSPVMKVYNLVKYIATVIAVVVLLFAGINYIVSGSDPMQRETSKSMAMYVVIGLVVIWAAPLVVNFIVG